jgi:hypothetical protein
VTIKELKKGKYFTLRPIEAPKENQVWVRGDYDRSARTYEIICFADVCRTRMLPGSAKVFTDFMF